MMIGNVPGVPKAPLSATSRVYMLGTVIWDAGSGPGLVMKACLTIPLLPYVTHTMIAVHEAFRS